MTAAFYRPVGSLPRPCTLIADNHDGTYRVRPAGWTEGETEIPGDQLFTLDEVENVGGEKGNYWVVKGRGDE